MTCHNGEINTIRTTRNAVSRVRPRAQAAAARRRPAHAEDERLGQPRRVARIPDARAELEPAPRPAAVDPARCGTPRRTCGGRKRSTCSPTTGGRSAASPRGTARPGSSAPTAACWSALVDRMGLRPVRWCSDKRGWLYIGSRVGRLRPRQHHDRRQRAASAGPDDRPRHRDRRAARQLPDHGPRRGRGEGRTRRRPRAEPPPDHHPRGVRLHAPDRRHRRRGARRPELVARPPPPGRRVGLRPRGVRQGDGEAQEGAAVSRWGTTAC